MSDVLMGGVLWQGGHDDRWLRLVLRPHLGVCAEYRLPGRDWADGGEVVLSEIAATTARQLTEARERATTIAKGAPIAGADAELFGLLELLGVWEEATHD